MQTLQTLINPGWAWFRDAPEALGGWAGAPDGAVCARLSGLADEGFWAEHDGRCADLIERRFESFQVVVTIMTTTAVVHRVLSDAYSFWLAQRVTKAVIGEIKKEMGTAKAAYK